MGPLMMHDCIFQCVYHKQRHDSLTIADQPDSVLSGQWIITKCTVGVVITVLQPLQI